MSSGIAVVLRYDKRTSVYGKEMSGTAFTLREETTEDAIRAVALARRQPEVDPQAGYSFLATVWGYATSRIARQDGKPVAPLCSPGTRAALKTSVWLRQNLC